MTSRRSLRLTALTALAALALACEPTPPVPKASPTPHPPPVPKASQAPHPPPVPKASPTPHPPPVPKASPRPPPPGFVDLRGALADACFTAGYAAADNFTGAPLPGYAVPGAWLLARPAAALARVQRDLASDGLTLLIFDAYRPRRASEAMVAWATRTGNAQLLTDGYIARRSGHNHGHTIDLGLARARTCEPLDMGTAWDTLDPRSHTARATGQPRSNRLRLRDAMRRAGFRDYDREWWHFSHPLPGTRARDVPYGPHEPDEDTFSPPTPAVAPPAAPAQ